MLAIINNIYKKNNFSKDTFTDVKNSFLTKYEKYTQTENDLSTAWLDLEFINRISYYKTMFQILDMSFNEDMYKMILWELKNDLERLWIKEEQTSRNLEKAQFLKNNFFINWTELVVFVKSPLWYYVLYNNSHLRVFNLSSNANWYHIHWNWAFCSWNTYQSLRDVAKEWDVYSLVMFLINILSNYDDKAHHLATPSDFTGWKKLDWKETWTKEELTSILNVIERKTETLEKELKQVWASEKALNYINEKVWELEDYLTKRVK